MSQQDGTPPPASANTSSFPLSSPSFWNEAATVAIQAPPSPPPKSLQPPSPQPLKRLREDERPSSPISDDNLFNDIDLDFAINNDGNIDIKRPRYESPSDSHPNKTTLSYLPKRSEVIDQDDPHSYLANPEYAPNRFGDIGDYMRKKEIKVQTQNRDIALASAQSGIPQIFAGLSFYINGNTHPPMEELRKMILQRGGEVRPVLRNKGMVKFIIAPMLTQSKFKQFERYKVVREGWITESCEQGKLLDWSRWKLQVQGGWEEGSRRGMEGFFRSTQQPDTTQNAMPVSAQPRAPSPTLKISTNEAEEDQVKPAPSLPSDPPPAAPSIRIAASQSLLKPHAALSIPISPRKQQKKPHWVDAGYVESTSPSTVTRVPPKVQKPEGAWEFYYSKESNENAAKAMQNQEWRLKNTAERGNEGGFIDGYYQNSRLHHLSTWKAELKVLVADAQRRSEELSLTSPSNATISHLSFANSSLPITRINNAAGGVSGHVEKVIFHVDFDCFFVSCGLATRPHLRGKPIVVCHSQAGKGASSTSEIASCSYEARAKGVKNGMSLGRARALVGDELQTIPYEFETYKKFSLAFYTILMGYADELQAVSVDEALIDVTSAGLADLRSKRRRRDPAIEIAEKIRHDVRKVTDGCEVSIGISHNILLAKLATRSAKPAGVAHLLPSDIDSFLAPLDVEDFPSIGYSIKSKIEEKFGSTKVEALMGVSKLAFQRVLGPKTGEMLWGYLRGMDERKLEPDKARKSVSAEMNYGIRFQNQDQAEMCIADLAAEVSKRMKSVGVRGRQITLKLMKRHPDAPIEPPKFLGHGWCETFNRSSPLSGPRGNPTDDASILSRESVKLLRAMKLDPVELRGVGIQITKLDSPSEDKNADREAGQDILRFQPKSKVEGGKIEREVTPLDQMLPCSASELYGSGGQKASTHQQAESETITSVKSTTGLPDLHASRSLSPITGPSRLPDTTAQPLAGSDGIDPSFLAALPPELADEVKRDYAQTRRSASRAGSEVPPPETVAGGNRASTISPSKPRRMHEAAHITRQLRPKMKTQMKAAQLADRPLFSAFNRAHTPQNETSIAQDYVNDGDGGTIATIEGIGVVDLTGSDEVEEMLIGGYRLSELKELGIDQEVFQALPDDMRKEIIEEERRKQSRRRLLHKPGNYGNYGTRGQSRERTGVSMSVSPGGKTSRAGSVPAQNVINSDAKQALPQLKISRPTKPALFKSTELQDVLQVIERWIESRNGSGPASRDCDKVKSYLIKNANDVGGLGGLDRAVEVIRWMRVLLREKWPSEEHANDHRLTTGDLLEQKLADNGKGTRISVGAVADEREAQAPTLKMRQKQREAGMDWWIVWREFRDEVSLLAQRKFGAVLKI
ncbi:hypothetical protein I316_01471 [Kwoniella heveanensis BCC8398]|uniref:DNA repair protein REV1 n=1 Tax=Kwoniella heveanensis BCC8398 TaxID=1296120 RepID=A0A1B9H0V6_9TREE|nr:hypothetical protein I316_01471 [Kwoniella heveanensis BCC8398]